MEKETKVAAVSMKNITKTFGSVIANDKVNLDIYKGEILSLLGENGSGKTTLMNMLSGIYFPDEGQIFINGKEEVIKSPKDALRLGIGMVHQHFKLIDVLSATENIILGLEGRLNIKEASRKIEEICDKYGFEVDPKQKIYDMTVSQKQTVEIVKVLYRGADILILDEPTNDLDITTLAILEDYLDNYDGIVITVSHDRYFLDRIAKRIFAFEQGNIRQYEGGYTDYLAKRPEDETAVGNAGTETSGKKADQTENADATENAEKKDSRATWKSGRKLKFTWQEQKDYETIEDDIAALEAKLEELDEKMGSFASDFVKLNELTQEKIKVEDELEHKMERWEYLEELNARIKAQDR